MEEEEEKETQNGRHRWLTWPFRILYSPRRTLKEIVKKPDIKGCLLLLVLVLLISVASIYVSGSKLFILTPTPEIDRWTEQEYSSQWSSNGNITFDETDTVTIPEIGTTSVVASISENNTIWLNFTVVNPFDCTVGNFEVLTTQLKWISSNDRPPDKAILGLSTEEDGEQFRLEITEFIPENGDQWVVLPIDIGPKNLDFTGPDSDHWENITGVSFSLSWNSTANLTLKIDSIGFGKYELLSATDLFGLVLPSFSFLTVFDFFLKWGLFSAGLWLVLRSFSTQKGAFKDLLYTAGYCFSGLLVYVSVRLVLLVVSPPIRSFDLILYYLLLASLLIFNAWPIALGGIALKEMYTFSGRKAVLLSILAYFVYFFVTMTFVFGISLERVLFTLP